MGADTINMKPPKRQYGFNLTELMVAITIGLIVLAGASSVMISNKKTYTAQDSLARLQENARIAMLMLTYEIRNIGYWGCNPDMENVHSTLNTASSFSPFWIGSPLEGADAATNTTSPSNLEPTGATLPVTPRKGTDVLMVRGLDASDSFQVLDVMTSESSTMKISDQNSISTGEVLVITDCNKTDIFQVTGRTVSGGFDNLLHSSAAGFIPGNMTGADGDLSKTYGLDAKIMRFNSTLYYIDTGASGEPSLFRRSLVVSGGNTVQPESQELVEGIENLQILYGVDTDADEHADVYSRASLVGATSWNNVVSIRFGIIARALANLQTTDLKTAATASQLDTKALDIDGDTIMDFTGTEMTSTTQTSGSTALDRQYQRRMFRTTVLLRNMPK